MAKTTLNFDELNSLEVKERYFKEMELSEGSIADREDLFVFLYDLFVLYRNDFRRYIVTIIENTINGLIFDNPEIIDFKREYTEKLIMALTDYGFSTKRYSEIPTFAESLINDITDTTIENVNTPYYLSDNRMIQIALNETNSIYNYVDYADAIRNGYKYKTWYTMEDEKVRIAHADVDALRIGINDMFLVGNELMRFPHDPNASLQNIVNCRCSCVYS